MAPPRISSGLTKDLVLAILPPLKDDPTVLKQVTDHIAREVKADVQGSSRMTWDEVDHSIAGLSRTARVRVQSDLADALDKAVSVLGQHRHAGQTSWEGDMPVKMSNLPQHVQFLLAMACQPTLKTHDLAHGYLHRKPPVMVDKDRQLFEEIMQEPFQGDHWGDGYDSEVQEGWTDSESERGGSSDSGGPEEAIITPHRERPLDTGYRNTQLATIDAGDRLREAEEMLRRLGEEAYWRTGGRTVESAIVKEGWRSVSNGSNVASLALSSKRDSPVALKAITGIQFQRELLFALSGRSGVMLDFQQDASCFIVSNHPTVLHYSPSSVESVLSTFQYRSTQASQIRRLISDTLTPIGSSSSQTAPRTVQAFAEACQTYMATIDDWIAKHELAIIRGSSEVSATSTPLSLQLDFDTEFGVMLDHLSIILPHAKSPIALLNCIYAILGTSPSNSAAPLLNIFIATAAPLWETLGEWLLRGMPTPRSLIDIESRSEDERPLDGEFWIHRDQDVSWADEDFWEAAFTIRNDRPDWISPEMLEASLEAGKARGLLRGLIGQESIEEGETWTPLSELLRQDGSDIGPLDVLDVQETLSAYLAPQCQLTTFQLRRVLDEDCGLQAHLDAIDGIFYFRGIDTLQPWTEWLFQQVISRKTWSDFQILTSTLRENIEKQGQLWMNPQAIRIDPGTKRRNDAILISPATLSNLRPSYRVPFPVSQLFTSTSLDLRADVFSFMLQIQFARYLISRTRLLEASKRDEETTSLLRLRHKLAWLVNTVWVWITERVIELETECYKAKLDETTSFGGMIQLELHHTRRIRTFSFQHAKTSSINESISAILEMTADLHDLFLTLSMSNSETEQPRPATPKDLHVQGRSRRRIKHHRRRNHDISSDDSDNDAEEDEEAGNRTLKGEVSLLDMSVKERVKRLEMDLKEKVQIIKTGVEELSRTEGGDDDQAEIWAMLSFSLEDWISA